MSKFHFSLISFLILGLLSVGASIVVKKSKESACSARDLGSIPESRSSSGEGNTQSSILTPVFLSGESHGQKSLVGYSPWGHKESDTDE